MKSTLKLGTSSWSNSCEMDTKIKIKEEDINSDNKALQDERELFTKNFAVKSNSDMRLESDCFVTIKTEIKSEIAFPDVSQKEKEWFSRDILQQITSENVTCNNNNERDTKIEIGLHRERKFLPQNYVIKVENYSSDEVDNKIEIKEEPWWLDKEHSSLCDNIKNGDFLSVKSPRLYTEPVSGDSGADKSLFTFEASEKNTSFNSGKDHLEYESQESDVTKMPPADKHVYLKQAINWNDTYNRASLTDKDERPHKCDICDKSFIHFTDLKRHNLIHVGKKPHTCKICKESFTHMFHLKKHKLIHQGKKPYKCGICDKIFICVSALKLHNLRHEGKKLHKCEICEKRFTVLSDLKFHNLMHEGKKPHRCEICEKSFTRLSSLKKHNGIHEGNKPHKCEICEKKFLHLSHLKRHNFIHEGIKPHMCEICGQRFTRLSDLKFHNMIHEGKKPHKCEICEKKFTRLRDLKRHNLVHEGKKPHQCKICEKKFTRLSYLKLHNLIHEGKKPHKCEICEKSFIHLSGLKRHNLMHEDKESQV